jgi:hypothetical protein
LAVQVAVIGSGVDNEARAAEVGRLLAERGCTVVCGARGSDGWEVEGVPRAGTPTEAVAFVLSALASPPDR